MAAKATQSKDAEILQSSLGPIIFQLALEQENTKDLLSLLKKIFNVFDTNANGEIDKAELQVLVDLELLDREGAKRLLAWDTNKDRVIQFSEFASFFASEFLSASPAADAKTATKPAAATATTAAPAAAAAAAAAAATAPKASAAAAPASPTVDTKTPKGKTVSELEQVPLPSKFQTALPPLVFRLVCREQDLRRIFGLFKKMFAVFDQNADGKIELKELTRLLDAGFLGPEEMAEFKEHAAADGTLDFTRFVSFWTAPLSKEEENILSSALGPIVFKIALEQQNIKELFELLNKLFNVFDSNSNGTIDKSEIKTLLECELLEEKSLKRLMTWDTNHDGVISFTEFCAFVSSEMLRQNVELLSGSQNTGAASPKPLPAKWDKELPPLLFRLATRQQDMIRVFNLFHKLFDVFDTNKDGHIDKREMQKLVQLELLTQADIDALNKWKTKKHDAVHFNEFIAWWISCAAESGILEQKKKTAAAAAAGAGDSKSAPKTDEKKNNPKPAASKPKVSTKVVAPLLFRLAAQREEIKKSFDLLKSLFAALDENKDGVIDRTEMAGLLAEGFIDAESLKKLTTFDANRDGKISFSEYLAFIADSLAAADGKL